MSKSDDPALNLACELTREHFGDGTEKVCRALLLRGKLTLAELMTETGSSYEEVRNHLIVLLQQHMVVTATDFIPPPRDISGARARKAPQLYEAKLEAILLRLRYPKFSIRIQDKFGDDAQLLFEEILDHGRLTADQCVSQALVTRAKAATEPYTDDPLRRQEYAILLVKLMQERYIERVRPTQMREAATKSERGADSGGGRKRKAEPLFDSSGRSSKSSRRDVPIELRILQGTLKSDGSEAFEDDVVMPSLSPSDLEAEAQRHVQDRESLWTVNVARFNQDFRNETIIQYVVDKLGAAAGRIVEAVITMTTLSQRTQADTETTHVRLGRLLAALNEGLPQQSEMSNKGLNAHMDTLSNHAPPLMRRLSDLNGGNFVVCLQSIANLVKQSHVMAIVEAKYGAMACRILRILDRYTQLEQKQIAEFAMLPPKECRELLYKLLKAGYVGLQEVPRSNDRVPARTLFLWKVHSKHTVDSLVSDMIKTMWNIKQRRQHELKLSADLVQIYESKPDSMSDMQMEKVTSLKQVVDRLDKMLLEMDDACMVLRDF